MENNPFKILNIPDNSDIESIKKAFRTLIKKNHPDITGDSHDKTASIIDAYREAVQKNAGIKSKNRPTADENLELFKLKYEIFFSVPFTTPKSKSAYFTHLRMLMKHLRSFLYSSRDFDFLGDYANILISHITPLRDPAVISWADYIYAIIENYRYLITFRRELLSGRLDDAEYKLEKLRLNIINYFNNIISAKNSLELRCAVFSEKEILTTDCIKTINRTDSTLYRQEIFTLLSIIMLFSEDDFVDYYPDMFPDM